jgi:hypothetical protein
MVNGVISTDYCFGVGVAFNLHEEALVGLVSTYAQEEFPQSNHNILLQGYCGINVLESKEMNQFYLADVKVGVLDDVESFGVS